jgi:low temperature requirement protein LtrA
MSDRTDEATTDLARRLRLPRMSGRDPGEHGRVSSPLELLFDLTFVVAVGTAAVHLADLLAQGNIAAGILAFVLAMFAICVAWISFSWFASAFGTDDWLYRALTMLQMIGVVVFSLGLPPMFASLAAGDRLDIRLMVVGYVVMRVAMVTQWWRAARESAAFHDVGMRNIRWTVISQACWVILAFVRAPAAVVLVAFVVLGVLELLLPVLAQGFADGTPWHPHHVAERYSLFAIITLGEGVVGTVASSSGLLGGADGTHWTADAIAVVVAGVGLTFGMWWVYFAVPFGDILVYRRRRGYLFGYGHIAAFVGIAGAGAGLHLAGLQLEHHADVSGFAVVLALAVPVALYLLTIYALHTLLLSSADPFHLLLISITVGVLLLALLLSAADAATAVCLLVIMLAPLVSIVGYETVGHRHQQEMIEQLRAAH